MGGESLSLADKDRVFPGRIWEDISVEHPGWSAGGLAALSRTLDESQSTAFMIVQAGRIVFRWGDLALKSSIASVRKSLINVLYGIFIAEGLIDTNATLADLGIDDTTPLTPAERQATVMDLLMARSGVYLPSVYDTQEGRPSRGAHPPGTHWFYNNGDFNVLGTILQRATGQNLFDAFQSQLMLPLQMEDCTPGDGRFQHGPQSSHPVYKISMSARDLARVGLLYLRCGRWSHKQIVSESWVGDSTAIHSKVGLGHGYGYLWWASDAHAAGDSMATHVPMFYASGSGGQYLIALPALDLVIVNRSASSRRSGSSVTHAEMGEILRLALSAMNKQGQPVALR